MSYARAQCGARRVDINDRSTGNAGADSGENGRAARLRDYERYVTVPEPVLRDRRRVRRRDLERCCRDTGSAENLREGEMLGAKPRLGSVLAGGIAVRAAKVVTRPMPEIRGGVPERMREGGVLREQQQTGEYQWKDSSLRGHGAVYLRSRSGSI